MAVFARPSADIARGSWTTQSGGSADLWASLDEEAADDSDYVISAIGNNSAYEVRLSSVAPAVIPRNHTLFLRGAKHAANGNTKGVDVSLVQGTTVLGTQSFPDLPATVTQQSIDLPREMAAGITDYANLRLRFTPTGITSGGSSRRRVVITGAALRVPSAVDLADDLLVRWGITVDSQNGAVQVSKAGFVGSGPNLWDAITELALVMWEADWNSAEVERRYRIGYYLRKYIIYEGIRAEIVAGTHPIEPPMTQQDALAIVDAKLLNFIAIVRSRDAEDGE